MVLVVNTIIAIASRHRSVMIAELTSTALNRRGIHHAWVVAVVTFLAMLTNSAALGLPGVTLP
jgi:hypothetical protein